MRLLTPENKPFAMYEIPDKIEKDFDLRYCVLDYSDSSNVDYAFKPLLFLDIFEKSAVHLKIGKFRIQMPAHWSIVVADKHLGMVELVKLSQFNDRDFDAFVFNPLKSYMPEFMAIEIIDSFPDTKWYFPQLKYGHILAVPLSDTDAPLCAYFVQDAHKIPESLDISQMV